VWGTGQQQKWDEDWRGKPDTAPHCSCGGVFPWVFRTAGILVKGASALFCAQSFPALNLPGQRDFLQGRSTFTFKPQRCELVSVVCVMQRCEV
jgi:hypothetical protein